MKGFAVVSRGLEKIAADDVRKLGRAKNVQAKEGLVLFEVDEFESFCRLAYSCQGVSRICVEAARFRVSPDLESSVEALKNELKGFDLKGWCEDSFSVECFREGAHDFNSHDFEMGSSRMISGKINFKDPETRFCCLIDSSDGYFGVDVAGFDLSKRDYRIFGHSSDLKATLAYGMVRLSGYDSEKLLLDPFSRSGAISIEAALFALDFPVNYYRKESFSFLRLKPFSKIDFERMFSEIDGGMKKEKPRICNFSSLMPHLKSAEKNAKISGVNKAIRFSRTGLEALDLKFEKGEVDLIVTYPPFISRSSNPERVKKVYNEFFYQAAHVLNKEGKVLAASREVQPLRELAERSGFRLSSSSGFSMGKDGRLVLVFEKA